MTAVDEFEVGGLDLSHHAGRNFRGQSAVCAAPEDEGWRLDAGEASDAGAHVDRCVEHRVRALSRGRSVERIEVGVDVLDGNVMTRGVHVFEEEGAEHRASEQLFEQDAADEGQQHEACQRRGGSWIDFGGDEHEVVDELLVFGGEGQRDGGAEAMAHDVAAPDLQGGDDIGDHFGEGLDAVVEAAGWGLFTLTESGQIERDDVERIRERRPDLVEGVVIAEEAVDEDEGGTASGLDDTSTDTASG